MELFDKNIKRVDRYAYYSESHFEFLNKSNKPVFHEIRNKMENWIENYPIEERDELISRIRSNNDQHFLSAFFELVLHQLFLTLGFKIEVHPQIDNIEKHPDFLISDKNKNEFYLEAVITTDKTQKQLAQESILNNIYDSINKLDTKNFFIEIIIENLPSKPIPSKKIRLFLEKKLKSLNPDSCEYLLKIGAFDLLPEWEFDNDGFKIKFRPLPKSKEYRSETTEKPIGIINNEEIEWIGDRKHLYKSLKNKALKYKRLGKPYIIAINNLGVFDDISDVINTLYGFNPRFYRKEIDSIELGDISTAFWGTKESPCFKRVDAILYIDKLYPWSVGVNNLYLLLNPWIESGINFLQQFSKFFVEENRLKNTTGKNLYELMNLPEKWPHHISSEII